MFSGRYLERAIKGIHQIIRNWLGGFKMDCGVDLFHIICGHWPLDSRSFWTEQRSLGHTSSRKPDITCHDITNTLDSFGPRHDVFSTRPGDFGRITVPSLWHSPPSRHAPNQRGNGLEKAPAPRSYWLQLGSEKLGRLKRQNRHGTGWSTEGPCSVAEFDAFRRTRRSVGWSKRQTLASAMKQGRDWILNQPHPVEEYTS